MTTLIILLRLQANYGYILQSLINMEIIKWLK